MRSAILPALAFLLYLALVAGLSDLALSGLSRPRGVAYGVTTHSLLIALALQGAATLFLARIAPRRRAALAILALNALLTALLFPGTGPGLAAFLVTGLGATALCLLWIRLRPA